DKAAEDTKAGRYVEAAGRALAGALPLLGPAAANAGETIASGDIAGGLGKTAGLLAPAAIGAVAPEAVGTRGAGSPEIGYAEKAGIPLDVAAATDNKALQALQHVTDRTLGGSVVATRAQRAQDAAVAAEGARLAEQANPAAVTSTQAGEAARQAIRDEVAA